jgi:Fur family ferric uptake transcriptional regulator
MISAPKSDSAVNPYQERMRERFYRILLEKNLKLTKPRRAMIDMLLRKRGWHFQAEEILQELNESNPGVVSRATVYRTLELMVQSGILLKTRVHENSYRYELADTEGHHHHLVDINSGKVVEFSGDKELHRMLRRICTANSFEENYHVLEVFGEFRRKSARRRAAKAKARR